MISNILEGQSLSSSQTKSLEASFKKGIPPPLRKAVWPLLIGNNLRINDTLYKCFLDRANKCAENIEKELSFKKNHTVLLQDLHRTYSEMKVFRVG